MLRDMSQLLQTAPSLPAWRGLSYPDPGRVLSARLPSSCRVMLPLVPCSRCRAHRHLSPSGLSLGFLPARAAAAPQATALGRLPHGPHHPCGAQAPLQGPVISCHRDCLPSCPGHGLQDALPVCAGAASQAALHNRYGPARPLCGDVTAGAAAGAGDKSLKGGGDAWGQLSFSPSCSQTHKCLGVLWLAAKRAEQT